MSSRKIAITSADGQTGHAIAELLLTDDAFTSKIDSVTLIAADTSKCADLAEQGATVVQFTPDVATLTESLKASGADCILLIPPARKDKIEITKMLIEATREAGVKNNVLLSSAGCDLAERDTQPRLREFIDIEALFMYNKGDTSTEAGHSPVVIRAGFYAENLLLYNKLTQSTGKLPIPIGPMHKFAPVALGDIALLAAYVLTSSGQHGLGDDVRGQLLTVTGPMMTSGNELATAASDALGVKVEFEDITEAEAKKILSSDPNLDESEMEYLLEYYSLVREGKTNYVSTLPFRFVTDSQPSLPTEFFEAYDAEFKPKPGGRKRKAEASNGDKKSKTVKTDGKATAGATTRRKAAAAK